MFVFLLYEGVNEKIEFEEGSTVEDIIRFKDVSPSTVLARIGEKIMPLETVLSGGETIKLFKVVSGG